MDLGVAADLQVLRSQRSIAKDEHGVDNFPHSHPVLPSPELSCLDMYLRDFFLLRTSDLLALALDLHQGDLNAIENSVSKALSTCKNKACLSHTLSSLVFVDAPILSSAELPLTWILQVDPTMNQPDGKFPPREVPDLSHLRGKIQRGVMGVLPKYQLPCFTAAAATICEVSSSPLKTLCSSAPEFSL